MANFVLIHGAWHGGWCWDKVAAILRERGHTVTSPDLPGHGDDPAPPTEQSMDGYVACIREALAAQDGPSILVGHSMGGMPVSAAAEAEADRVAKLVYLCAFLPRDGEHLLGIEERNPRPTVPPAAEFAEDGTATIPAEKHRTLFYGQVSDAAMAEAQSKLVPQSGAPFMAPVSLSNERFGRIEKHYIECTEDGAISIELQRDMIGKTPGVTVHTMHADHSPFLSDPEGLAGILERIAA